MKCLNVFCLLLLVIFNLKAQEGFDFKLKIHLGTAAKLMRDNPNYKAFDIRDKSISIDFNNESVENMVSIMEAKLTDTYREKIYLEARTEARPNPTFTDHEFFILKDTMTPKFIIEHHPLQEIKDLFITGFNFNNPSWNDSNLDKKIIFKNDKNGGTREGSLRELVSRINLEYKKSGGVDIDVLSLYVIQNSKENFICSLGPKTLSGRECELKNYRLKTTYTCFRGRVHTGNERVRAYSESHAKLILFSEDQIASNQNYNNCPLTNIEAIN